MLSQGILFTDHYQLTMAQLYWQQGIHLRPAQFDHFFRSYPDYGTHQAGYCIAAGLGQLVEWMETVRVDEETSIALAGIRSTSGAPVFSEGFLSWLREIGGFGDVAMWAVPEGRVVHPNTPVAVVEAPLAVAQILETALLNHLNFATLIATKASRVVEAAHGGRVIEFGLRRAPGWAGNTATRSSLIGGCVSSSNVGMSLDLGMVSSGTHAHSMVQVFMAIAGGELEAFRAYAEVYPDDCLLLVDTIDTLESGVPNAITVFEELRRRGHRPVGIRLDSGDLAHLAVRSAAMLDAAGFSETRIVLSSQLDEITIFQIRNQILDEAPRFAVDGETVLRRLVYGVGSRMVTSHGDPSLDGVYKTVAVQDDTGTWKPAIKISDNPEKVVYPGAKRVWRVYDERGLATADLIALREETIERGPLDLIHPSLPGVHRSLPSERVSEVEPLLVLAFQNGQVVAPPQGVEDARRRRIADLARLDAGVKRLVNPHTYHVSLTPALADLKRSLMASLTN